ncbi:aminoglycoside phosphotransferase family protein [Usitatibacter palustris]|uniref:N-acetylmuramate/N-acetylglucosamine kinase n=1 Tax=Usitatibacter palustris TaxID=2732487 RepID=A0A6M4H4Q1_9PROT|nr:phosphotransferase [Usitatibacter palustris]QJR13683.1 N-acetylmuramate/N-acetylglucosamine kinase [Usitatibacter palustris]
MTRLAALDAWLGAALDGAPFRREPASADASFRRYFRIFVPDRTYIVMDAPPEREDSRPFVHVAGLLRAAGLNAPEIYAQDLAQGFLLLTDLGPKTYLQSFGEQDPDALFRDAIAALVTWQGASREGALPPYDETLLRREIELFPEWYVKRHRGVELDAGQREKLEGVFRAVLAANLAEPRVFVHRDFMPRNLMVSAPNPGIIDFQDAVYGPISYDIACLLRDAYVSWEEPQVIDWTIRYWERARKHGLPVPADFADFWRNVEWMGLQRHLKVAGIFARLHYRDGKAGYIDDAPRFIGYIRKTAGRYRELEPLLRLVDQIEGAHVETRLTF